jgi:hypothetical protein
MGDVDRMVDEQWGQVALEEWDREHLRSWILKEGDLCVANTTGVSRLGVCRGGLGLPLTMRIRRTLVAALAARQAA